MYLRELHKVANLLDGAGRSIPEVYLFPQCNSHLHSMEVQSRTALVLADHDVSTSVLT